MLTNEYFGVTIRIANDFDMMFENVRLSVNVPVNLRNKGTFSKKVGKDAKVRLQISKNILYLEIFSLYSQFLLHPIYRNHVKNWCHTLR